MHHHDEVDPEVIPVANLLLSGADRAQVAGALLPTVVDAGVEPVDAARYAWVLAGTILESEVEPEPDADLASLRDVGKRIRRAVTNPLSGVTFAAEQTVFRALYAVNAAKRLAQAWRAGDEQLEAAQQAEARHLAAHRQADADREDSYQNVQALRERYGDVLGWYSVAHPTRCKTCEWAEGKNFNATSRPSIGRPGSVHVHCRCTVGPPHDNAPIIP